MISDITYELKQRAINAKPDKVKVLLDKLQISSYAELVNHYGYRENIYNKLARDYLCSLNQS